LRGGAGVDPITLSTVSNLPNATEMKKLYLLFKA
jgi:hypothetical protein